MSGWGKLGCQSKIIADYIDRLDWSREDQEKLLKMIFIDIGWPKNPRPLNRPKLVMQTGSEHIDGN